MYYYIYIHIIHHNIHISCYFSNIYHLVITPGSCALGLAMSTISRICTKCCLGKWPVGKDFPVVGQGWLNPVMRKWISRVMGVPQ